ncbi:MAG TPA: hypothetical protein VFV37_09280 [Luteibaculaceae bacterium]|nr:hypothetical protein [Luteibaculaceae bacterium]
MKKLVALAVILAIGISFADAQVRITKRKHLKGYHLELGGRKNKAEAIKSSKDEKAIEVKEHSSQASQLITQPVIESPAIEFSEAAPVVTSSAVQDNPQKAVKLDRTEANQKKTLAGKGAQWVAKKAVQKVEKLQKKLVKNGNGPNETFAIIGFICSVLAVLAFTGAGFLLFFCFPGLIFSILGLKSDQRVLAIIGTVISSILVFLTLVAILLVAAFISTL